MSFAGANAIVFAVEEGSAKSALRFFTNGHAASPERYRALSSRMNAPGLEDLASCRWLDDAIAFGGHAYPALLMEWIDGVLLDQYALQLAGAGASSPLRALAEDVVDMVSRLQREQFAHCDLQHGNVLIDRETGDVRLVDFDSVWLPELAQTPPSDTGHRSYQHPERLEAGCWGPGLDTFSALVISTSLLALAVNPSLWHLSVEGSHLLFSDRDLKDASQGAPTILDDLTASADSDLARSAAALLETLRSPIDTTLLIDDALPVGQSSTSVDLIQGSFVWWNSGEPHAELTATKEPSGKTETFEFRVPDPLKSTPGSPRHETEDRPLPDVGIITNRLQDTEGPPQPASAPQNTQASRAESSWWDEPSPAGGTETIHGSKPASLTRRVLAGLLDLVLLMVIPFSLPLVIRAYRDGRTPGRDWLGLRLVQRDGSRPSAGRIAFRELGLKFVPIAVLTLAAIAQYRVVAAEAAIWLLVAVLPIVANRSGRTLFELITGIGVVRGGNRPSPGNAP